MVAFVVCELVGHAYSKNTDQYYNQISIEKIKVELDKFEFPKPKDDLTSKSPHPKIFSSLSC